MPVRPCYHQTMNESPKNFIESTGEESEAVKPERAKTPREVKLEYKKISRDNPQLLERIATHQTMETRHIFGLGELTAIQGIREEEGEMPENEEDIKDIFSDIKRKIIKVCSAAKDNSITFGLAADNLFTEGADNPDVLDYLKKTFPESIMDTKSDFGIVIIAQSIIPHVMEIPDDIIEKLLRAHIAKWKEKEKEFQEQVLPELKITFEANFRKFTRKKSFPMNLREAGKRLAGLQVTHGDFLNYGVLSEKAGDYRPENHTATIETNDLLIVDESDKKAFLNHVFTHEIIHALSGEAIIGSFLFGNLQRRSHQRVGLKISQNFNWLNEAVTENLTAMINGDKAAAYPKERKLLKLICSSARISEKDFIDAYFEDYILDAPPGKRLPAWHKLMERIETMTRKSGFLVGVDKIVREEGIDAAITLLEEQKNKTYKRMLERIYGEIEE